MRKLVIVLVTLGAACVAASGYGQTGMRHGRGMHGAGMMNVSMIRHRFVMQHGIAAQYAAKVSPLDPTAQDIDDGQRLYEQHCATCHGPTGLGDGEAGRALSPAPANIAVSVKMPMATDAYLFWTIAEGGVPLETAMPPFAGALQEAEVWKLVSYLRTL
jgi:mono/diheme cytochrome c family protein